MAIKRRLYYKHDLDVADAQPQPDQDPKNYNTQDLPEEDLTRVTRLAEANLISSRIGPVSHAPVIDIDVPIRVIPSTQPGHYHLYVDHEVTWTHYIRILRALQSAGLVESGFLNSALQRGETMVRVPGVLKGAAQKVQPPDRQELSDRIKELQDTVHSLRDQLAAAEDEIVSLKNRSTTASVMTWS